MAKLTWDESGKKFYSTGISEVALYVMENGTYGNGVAWSGVTKINESPEGGDATDLWADNIKYGSIRSTEKFKGTIEAYDSPEEFDACDGTKELTKGVFVTGQARATFGLAYKTQVFNDASSEPAGYILHLVYGATASPTQKEHNTINDNPDAEMLSWEFDTTPVNVTGAKPTSHLKIDSRTADATKLAALEKKLYGDTSAEPTFVLPDAVVTDMKVSG